MSTATLTIPLDEGYEVFEDAQPQEELIEEAKYCFLGGPLDGGTTDLEENIIWVSLPTKNKGLLALYEKKGERYVYRKTVEGYPDSRKQYSNVIKAEVVRTTEPVNWVDSFWRQWNLKETYSNEL